MPPADHQAAYSTFEAFVEGVVLPARALNPAYRRLDGAQSGGNWDIAGVFEHHGKLWTVHADTHFEPLLIAYEAGRRGSDPFVESATKTRVALDLTDELRARLSTPRFKYIYIYEA